MLRSKGRRRTIENERVGVETRSEEDLKQRFAFCRRNPVYYKASRTVVHHIDYAKRTYIHTHTFLYRYALERGAP